MPHSTELPPGTVQADINYHNDKVYPPTEQHVEWYMTSSARRQKLDRQPVNVYDIRHTSEKIGIDNTGFDFVKFDIKDKLVIDDEQIRKEIYPEAEALLKKHIGCTSAHPMSHIVRNEPYTLTEELNKPGNEVPDLEIIQKEQPQRFAHVDQSHSGAYEILSNDINALEHFSNAGPTFLPPGSIPDLAAESKYRWAIVNVWKPLKPVQRDPLAVCDGRTVAESDLRPVISRMSEDLHPSGKQMDSEYLQVAYNPDHRWYWASDRQPDEALLIKCFDSKLDGRVRRCPHTAISTEKDHGPTRESIEIRSFVFWEDEERE